MRRRIPVKIRIRAAWVAITWGIIPNAGAKPAEIKPLKTAITAIKVMSAISVKTVIKVISVKTTKTASPEKCRSLNPAGEPVNRSGKIAETMKVRAVGEALP